MLCSLPILQRSVFRTVCHIDRAQGWVDLELLRSHGKMEPPWGPKPPFENAASFPIIFSTVTSEIEDFLVKLKTLAYYVFSCY